jgi:hypothetical protein
MRLWILEQFNMPSLTTKKKKARQTPWNKEIVILRVLGRAVVHRSDEKGFGQHSFYETKIVELLNAKTTDNDKRIFYQASTFFFSQ